MERNQSIKILTSSSFLLLSSSSSSYAFWILILCSASRFSSFSSSILSFSRSASSLRLFSSILKIKQRSIQLSIARNNLINNIYHHDFCSTYLQNQKLYGATERMLQPVLYFSFRTALNWNSILLFLFGHWSYPPTGKLLITLLIKPEYFLTLALFRMCWSSTCIHWLNNGRWETKKIW